MSANLRLFTRCVYAFDAVVARVPDERWDAPSPCEGWDATAVVAHQCAVLHGVVDMARTGAPARPNLPETLASLPPTAQWAATRDELLDALDHLGVLHQRGPFWFDTATIDDLVAMVAWDPLTHAWDLAESAGIAHGLSDDLLLAVLPSIEVRSELLVSSGRVAAIAPPPDGAPVLTRYLAAVGRAG